MADDKIRLGDILWEYADFAPAPTPPPASRASERRAGTKAAQSPPAPQAPQAHRPPPPPAPPPTGEEVFPSSLEDTLISSVGAFVQEELAKSAPPPAPTMTPEPESPGRAVQVKELLDRAISGERPAEPPPAQTVPTQTPPEPRLSQGPPPGEANQPDEPPPGPSSPPPEPEEAENPEEPELLIDFEDGEPEGDEEAEEPEFIPFVRPENQENQGGQGPQPPPAEGEEDEEEEDEALFHRFRERRDRPPEDLPPDAPPEQLAREYEHLLGGLGLRTAFTFVLTGLLLLLTLADTGVLPALEKLLPENMILPGGLVILGVCAILAAEVLEEGVKALFRGKPDGDTLAVFATLFTVVDAATLLAMDFRGAQLPFFAPCALVLAFHLLGHYCALSVCHQACKTAASVPQPYVLTKEEGILQGQNAFCKWMGAPKGFGSQLRSDSTGTVRFRRLTPVLLTACTALALVTTVAHHQPKLAFWSLSALFIAGSTLGCDLTLTLPLRLMRKRHAKLGVALAGFSGIQASRSCRLTTIGDYDLYPPGTVILGGVRTYGSMSADRMVSLAASVVRVSASGLAYPFDRLMRSQGGAYVPVERLLMQPGGLMGQIGGLTVYVGNASLMTRLGLTPPSEAKAKDNIFCAVDGELVGSFTLHYNLHPAILPSMRALFSHRLSPVLITRDFNLTPHRLRLSGKLPAKRISFPPLQQRFRLSDSAQPHGKTMVAVICREGLPPLVHALISARRTGTAHNIGSTLVCISACVGVVLTAALSSAGAVSSLTAWTLSLFLLLWVVPPLLLSLWVGQY